MLAVDSQRTADGALKERLIALEESEPSTCAICLSEDTMAKVKLACEHKFHPACIDQWLQAGTNCPECRNNVHPQHRSEIAVLVGRVRQMVTTAIPGVAPDDQGLLPMGVCEARVRLVGSIGGFAMLVTGIVFLAMNKLELNTEFMLISFGLCTMVASPCIGRFRQPEGHEPRGPR